ncbi:MAG: hypothetical protein E7Z93_00935 [Cyanobacteria bacterium SIG32]|nr:hypothetical protein [Cyanobacteria bacterium SIG32]
MIKLGGKTIRSLYDVVAEKVTSNPFRGRLGNAFERSPVTDVVDIDVAQALRRQKEVFIENSPLLNAYSKETQKEIYTYRSDNINVLDELDIDGLKELEKVCEEVYQNTPHWKGERVNPHALKNFIDLYYRDPETYRYCLNSEVINKIFMEDFRSHGCIPYMNMAMAKEIEKGRADCVIMQFVEDSDVFYHKGDKIDELSKLLSTNKTTGRIIAHRGERHVGQFADIPVGEFMTKKIKLANFINRFGTKKADFTGFDKQYSLRTQGNIYDYIKSKDELSLADAMLMMKYVDKTTQKEILELIKKAQIKPDGRFKSTTFSRDFARSWIGTCSNYAAKDQPKILAKLNLEEGCEGYFVQGFNCGAITGGNGQCEFILNNKATHMTVKDVTFDPEKNIFNIEYDVFQ